MCWSVPWPGAVEAEGLTRVPSGVCDCAHGGRVVKEASIARLFRSRGVSGSDLAHKSIFLRKKTQFKLQNYLITIFCDFFLNLSTYFTKKSTLELKLRT